MRKFMAVLVALLAAVFSLTACGGGAHAASGKLIGTWYQTNAKSTSVNMIAVTTPGNIRIDLISGSSRSLYWVGTFDTKRTSSKFSVTSRGDKSLMDLSLTGSQDSTKKFKYKRGVLSFKFTAVGQTQTIKLSKSKPGKSKKTATNTISVKPSTPRITNSKPKVPTSISKPKVSSTK